MRITASTSIRTPEITELDKLKALSDAAQAHKYFQDNPKVIDNLAKSISGAYALTEAERKERDDAVQALADSKKAVAAAAEEVKSTLALAEQTKKAADARMEKTISDANEYKKNVNKGIDDRNVQLIETERKLKNWESELEKEQNQLKKEQEIVAEGLQKIAEWTKEKADWEQDFSDRSTKLAARERKALRG